MRFKTCAIIEILTHENVSPTEMYNRLCNFHDETTIDVSNVRCLARKIRVCDGTVAVNDKSQSSKP